MRSLTVFFLVLAVIADAAFAARLVPDGAISPSGRHLTAETFSDRRPLYVISHRTNGISALQQGLTPINQAANAIEIDINYGKPLLSSSEPAWVVDHDGVFGWSTKLPEWIDAVNGYINQGADVSLLILDTKTTTCGVTCAKSLRELIRNRLSSQVTIIYSVATYEERNFYQPLFDEARNSPNEGFSIDYDNDPLRVQEWFVSNNINNFYYGNGILEYIPDQWTPNIYTSLVKAGQLRDSEKKIKKTYAWTMVKESTMLRYLTDAQVDGIMANPPQVPTLRRAAEQVGRIATPQDNPFTVFTAASQATTTAPRPSAESAGFDVAVPADTTHTYPPPAPASSASQVAALLPTIATLILLFTTNGLF